MTGKLALFVASPLAVLLAGATAQAQPPHEACPAVQKDCAMDPNYLLVTGSPALVQFFKRIGPQLKKADGTEVYYVRNVGQCQGAQQVAQGQDLGPRVLDFLGLTDDAIKKYGGDRCCKVPSGLKAHLSISDYATADCFEGALPDTLREYAGPIVPYAMVVPRAGPQLAITMEEAYFALGFGNDGYQGHKIWPWTDQSRFAVPGLSFGPHVVWSKFLRIENPQRLKGLRVSGAERVIPTLVDPKFTAEGAIGLTTTQAYDTSPDRAKVRTLAIQGWRQKHAFYPDSTPTSFDKRNVRDGHYPWWAPLSLVTRVENGKPANARAEAAISYVQLKGKLEGVNLVDALVAGGLVPTCAMKVERAADQGVTGDLRPYAPAPGTACGCAMEEAIYPGGSGCASCDDKKPCTGGKTCSHGYCE